MRKTWTATIGLGCIAAASAAYWSQGPSTGRIDPEPRRATPRPVSHPAAAAGIAAVKAATTANAAAASTPFQLGAMINASIAQANIGSLRIGDVTGDGLDDLIVSTYPVERDYPTINAPKLMIYRQQADGTLAPPVGYSDTPNGGFGTIELVDLNNDGLLDIVVGRGTGVGLWTADGAGGFNKQVFLYDASSAAGDITSMDVDKDGYADVITNSQLYGGTSVLYGDGAGGIRLRQRMSTPQFYTYAVAADVTDDGEPDLMIHASLGLHRFTVYPHDRVGRFDSTQAYEVFDGGGSTTRLTVGDFNGDGRNDVASATAAQEGMMHLHFQDGYGRLQNQPGPTITAPQRSLLAVDLDRDGQTDVFSAYDYAVGYYLQDRGVFGPEQTRNVSSTPFTSFPSFRTAAGDLNSDGCTDVAVGGQPQQNLMLFYGQNCKPVAPTPAVNDIDGDGKSDMLWRNDAKSHWAYWTMNGAAKSSGMSYPVGADWSVVASGDFQGDGRLDLIWTDGRSMQMWKGTAGGFIGEEMTPFPAGFRVVAVGDIDSDGKSDLIWRDQGNTSLSAWTMDGARIVSRKGYRLPAPWQVVGSGDLNGDGRMDLICSDGQRMQLWSNTSRLMFERREMGGYPQGWELAGTGDTDGDGRSDLFWRNAGAGAFVIWKMAGPRRISGATHWVDGAWRIVSSGDYTGDRKTDLVWSDGNRMQLWASTGQGFAGLVMPDYPSGWSPIQRWSPTGR